MNLKQKNWLTVAILVVVVVTIYLFAMWQANNA